MNKKYTRISNIILPNKKVNFLAISILFLGIVLGAIFAVIINTNDKTIVIEKINLFITNINNGQIDSILTFKNSVSVNLLYVFIIWILGLALLGVIFNLFILFIKSFIVSFSMAAFIIAYSYKGIILSSLYLLFGQLINIFIILILTIYSMMFSLKLLTLIFKNNNGFNIRRFLKNYSLILLFSIIISVISSLSESFLLPSLIKLLIKLYI